MTGKNLMDNFKAGASAEELSTMIAKERVSLYNVRTREEGCVNDVYVITVSGWEELPTGTFLNGAIEIEKVDTITHFENYEVSATGYKVIACGAFRYINPGTFLTVTPGTDKNCLSTLLHEVREEVAQVRKKANAC